MDTEAITLTTTIYHDAKPSDPDVLAVEREGAKVVVTDHGKRSRGGIAVFTANHGDGDMLTIARAVEARIPMTGQRYWLVNGKGNQMPLAHGGAVLTSMLELLNANPNVDVDSLLAD